MDLSEVRIDQVNADDFIRETVGEISHIVGDSVAFTALSGGVDSSVVTMLGHMALGDRLKIYFIDNGLMRVNEADEVESTFGSLGIRVEVYNAQEWFFTALKGVTDPEKKRRVISQVFYGEVFLDLLNRLGIRYLLQGTILTDIEETIAGIKRQHNVFEQLGIDPKMMFGYQIVEPISRLRKDSVRNLAKALGLPESIYNRMPFPGPALAARIIGEVTPKKIELIRYATIIMEAELAGSGAFQCMAILHNDRVTGIRNGKRDFGLQIEIRCWDSIDARTARPTRLPYDVLEKIADRILAEVPGVVSVTYNIACKPPSTMEAI